MQGFPARFAGYCHACETWWKPGDLIKATSNPANLDGATWQHEICPDAADSDPTALRKGESVCSKCFLVHPGECPW